jgi:hypothetical protein
VRETRLMHLNTAADDMTINKHRYNTYEDSKHLSGFKVENSPFWLQVAALSG